MRKRKSQEYRDFSWRPNELNNSKTENKSEKDASKQIISHIEEVKDQVKFRIKEFKKNIKLPSENPFDFTEFVRKRKEAIEIDLVQSSTSKHSHRKYGKIEKCLYYEWFF